MEIKLESLIEKIKKEAVLEAQKHSQELINNAKEEAAKILDDAKRKGNTVIEESKKEAAKFEKNAQVALRQAARDVVLMAREQLTRLFDAVLTRDIQKTLTPEYLKEIIVKIIEKWSHKKDEALEILVSEEDKQRLEELLLSQIKKEAKNKIVIKVSGVVNKGFRIGIEGENVHYDFSDEGILEAFKAVLNPALSALLDNNG